MHWFDPLIYCRVFTTVASARASIISHRHFFFEVRTIKISSLSSFDVYNTTLLAVITMWDSAFLISCPRWWPCRWPTDHTLGSGAGLSTPGTPHPSLQNWPILSPPSFLLWSAPAAGKSCVFLRVLEVCLHAQKHTHTLIPPENLKTHRTTSWTRRSELREAEGRRPRSPCGRRRTGQEGRVCSLTLPGD